MGLLHAFIRMGSEPRHPILLGIILVLLASFSYGSTHTLARYLVTDISSPLVVSFFSTLSGTTIIALIAARRVKKDLSGPKRGVVIMALAGVAGICGSTILFVALSHAPVATVSPILAINPLVSIAIAHLFMKRLEHVTPRIWIGAIMAVCGVCLITIGST
ncbi:MAG: hypothetical protein BZY82_01990 [SAR202 cluster bacterium Io17-Chloro-G3]|nr:MAG: hypothetical protein BZY82_01990 [SAR202 cluster bacterium Io17-Chloro-G3]